MTQSAVRSWWKQLVSPETRNRRRHRRRLELIHLESRITPSKIIANDDFADTDGNNPVQVAVLENDQAVGTTINPATVQIVAGAAHGSTTINTATGDVTYTAIGNFRGTDT